MTIEERLEKLVERHEALAQTVELTAAMHRAHEEEFAAMKRETEARMTRLIDAIESLVEVVRSHENRIRKLEDRP